MAEAFGIATGVLQVAGFGAAVGGTLFQCAKEILNANKELETIAAQVKTTSKSLDAVGALLLDPETKDFHTARLYEDTTAVSKGCNEVFCELETAVNAFESKSGKFKLTVIARLQWPLSSTRLMDLQKVLKHYGDVLHLMLAVLQIVEGRRAATKEELIGLEAQLRSLVISNNSLSEANKSLSDTIAAITRHSHGLQNPATVNAVAFTSGPTTSAYQTENQPRQSPERNREVKAQALDVPPGEQLLRCMEVVQELATSISCAMDAWQGQPQRGKVDVHGSFAKVTACFEELPRTLQCTSCMRRMTWPKLNPDGSEGSRSTCVCFTNPSSVEWKQVKGLRTGQRVGLHRELMTKTANETANNIASRTTTVLLEPQTYSCHKTTELPSDSGLPLPPPPPQPQQQPASSFPQTAPTLGSLPDLVPRAAARERENQIQSTYDYVKAPPQRPKMLHQHEHEQEHWLRQQQQVQQAATPIKIESNNAGTEHGFPPISGLTDVSSPHLDNNPSSTINQHSQTIPGSQNSCVLISRPSKPHTHEDSTYGYVQVPSQTPQVSHRHSSQRSMRSTPQMDELANLAALQRQSSARTDSSSSLHLRRPPSNQTSATYIPSGCSYGPDIGIPDFEVITPRRQHPKRRRISDTASRSDIRKGNAPAPDTAALCEDDPESKHGTLRDSSDESHEYSHRENAIHVLQCNDQEGKHLSNALAGVACAQILRTNQDRRHRDTEDRGRSDTGGAAVVGVLGAEALHRAASWRRGTRSKSRSSSRSRSRTSLHDSRGIRKRSRSRSRETSRGRQPDGVAANVDTFPDEVVAGIGFYDTCASNKLGEVIEQDGERYRERSSRPPFSLEKLRQMQRYSGVVMPSSNHTNMVAKTDDAEATEEPSAIQSLLSRWVEKDASSLILNSDDN